MTAKSFFTADVTLHFKPDFEPSSPRPPPGPRRYTGFGLLVADNLLRIVISANVGLRLFKSQQVSRLAPEGVHRGGRLEAGEKWRDYKGNLDRLRGQRLPYAIFFGYFLAWLQESKPHIF